MADDFARLDATAQAELVRRGEVHPRELVEAAIRRMEALNPALNAIVHPAADEALAAADSPHLPEGPFRGVPFALKDLWPTEAGRPFHCGNRALAEIDHRAAVDANVTAAYRAAGLVFIGRTNTPELGLVATTEPEVHGASRNPWNPDHGTGGSSGGAAAAVAGGILPAANASDGGGSIRIPASACGLVGLKPSRGRMSMGPQRDEAGLSVQHVVSHTVRDSAGLLDVVARPFPGDALVAPAPARPFAEEVGSDPGRLRIALLPRSLAVDTHPECEKAARETAATLERLGHAVEETHPPALASLAEDPRQFMATWVTNCRLSLEWIGSIIGREVTEDDVEPATWVMSRMADELTGPDLGRAQAAQAAFRRAMGLWWAEGWDLLLSPTAAEPPPRLGDLVARPGDPLRALVRSTPFATFTSPFNVTGQPAVSLPVHRTSDGLPVGVQLVAAYGREDQLVRVAAQLESEVRWAEERAQVHP